MAVVIVIPNAAFHTGAVYADNLCQNTTAMFVEVLLEPVVLMYELLITSISVQFAVGVGLPTVNDAQGSFSKVKKAIFFILFF